MKPSLKRIEVTLQDLGNQKTVSHHQISSSHKASFSFEINVDSSDIKNESTPPEETSHHNCVQTFSTETDGNSPSLPKFKTPSFNSHHNAPNPALATNLLQEIQQIVAGWQQELQKTVRQIQDIYLEGPIVNGWLESYEQQSETAGAAKLRHAEVEHLMNYVEEICAQKGNVSSQTRRAEYRLCGLDPSGQLWSRPCPGDQIASVSMGIARYQKLRQLLGRKQYLETRLSQLAETLVVLHGHIQTSVKI